MSRFETSRFVRNRRVMRLDCVKEACDKLGWKYRLSANGLAITDVGLGQNAWSEDLIIVSGDQVSYNSYALGGNRDVQKLQDAYAEIIDELNAEYSRQTVINAFKKNGFTYKSNEKFKAAKSERFSFFMVGRSKDKEESEPVGQIKFTILSDGTVVSDSNYLPEDVNKRAHASMDAIDGDFASKRVMTKKDVPPKYREKVAQTKARYVKLFGCK